MNNQLQAICLAQLGFIAAPFSLGRVFMSMPERWHHFFLDHSLWLNPFKLQRRHSKNTDVSQANTFYILFLFPKCVDMRIHAPGYTSLLHAKAQDSSRPGGSKAAVPTHGTGRRMESTDGRGLGGIIFRGWKSRTDGPDSHPIERLHFTRTEERQPQGGKKDPTSEI